MREYVLAFFDMCAFIGAAYFFLTKCVLGPVCQMFEKNMYVADLNKKAIVREYTGEMAPG